MARVWPLTLEAWRLTGRELPSYERAEMPVRVVRGDPGWGREGESQ